MSGFGRVPVRATVANVQEYSSTIGLPAASVTPPAPPVRVTVYSLL